MGPNPVHSLELPQAYMFKEQKIKFSQEYPLMRQDANTRSQWDSSVKASVFAEANGVDPNGNCCSDGLCASSLSEIFDNNLRLATKGVLFGQSIDTVNSNYEEDEPFESTEEIEAQFIGNLLPDDDDLLSGVFDDIGYIGRSNGGDDIDDDIFCSGGGLELEADENVIGSSVCDFNGGLDSNGLQVGPNGPFPGEHPHGEHPSRTLFVRNINSNVEDTELRALFEQYGDIRTLYTACKHRGFVMISYYDIRSARNAMKALQNMPLRRRKLDIHFSIPKENPSEKDINQGTLVVCNLDSSVTNDDLHQIFCVYGEIKEIGETPFKSNHKSIEFYDVRAADAALRALNRSDIAGKKIKLQPSCPGGARHLNQQLSPELEQEEFSEFRQGSPNNSPSACFAIHGSYPGEIKSHNIENGAINGLHSSIRAPISPFVGKAFHNVSSPVRVASLNHHNGNQSLHELSHSLGFQGIPPFHPHSLPEHHNGVVNGTPYNSTAISAVGININSRLAEGADNRHLHKVNGHSFDHNNNAFVGSGNGSCPLHGHQYGWNNSSSAFHHHALSPMLWPNSSPFASNVSAQMHGIQRQPSHMLNNVVPVQNHHVGSAPSFWDRQQSPYSAYSAEALTFHPASLGTMAFPGSPGNIFPHNGGSHFDPSMKSICSAHIGIPSPQHRFHLLHARNNPVIPMPASFGAANERMRSRRSDPNPNQPDNKKQYELDIEQIMRGEDSRTTLMIKNIPNKYTSKMLLATIDENHKGTYDFIYLPIDFKNKCNVGYAFINMINPQHIIPFYQSFNGKKWEKFNSEKVASLAYARIQGKAALIGHFQNSSLMNEDKRCRPILFHSEGPNAGDQEPFPVGNNVRTRSGRSRSSASNEETHQGSPSSSANGESSTNGLDAPPTSS
ncbi:protein MEI2-like 4 isoform X2 [Ananas comosus]|uniref:Protein MEI2-like 4 isoform X2 n=1 Tax=Ananas comosus TaxID=4615 RepID=A0A6P5GNL7_ANACO|nr:protein MEI2-like 4 isoform X2 [Ananas comosus]